MATTHRPDTNRSVLLSREIDDLLLDVRGLILVRDLLAERGATTAEIAAHTNELQRRRRQLVDMLDAA
jgi:hypothetical protein